ncbi:MAG TPA: DUF1801 domain-containing protein [Flavobacteriales bacterium]|jgi:hypothetical protein|nr:DUF1801 domain-containing protein [Flavobacteriales bacterium]
MATKKTAARKPAAPHADDVDAFMAALDHPMKAEIEAVRRAILAADPSITEGIKWSGPSFRTSDFFATLNNPSNPRTSDHVALVLHTGVSVKGLALQGAIADPEGLLKWVAKDRCLVTFRSGAEIKAKRAALQAIVRAWITSL